MKSTGKKIFIIKLLWFIACISTLLNLFSQSNNFQNQEAIITFALSMIAVTYPSGFLVWALFSLKAKLAPGALFSNEVDMIIRWLGFVFVGYFQWFIALPKLIVFIKKILIKNKTR